jgi:hypothetical protein
MREYQLEGRGAVGTISEYKKIFPGRKFVIVDNISNRPKLFTPMKVQEMQQKLESGRTLHFESKEARDTAYKELKGKLNLRRSSRPVAQLHPEYVEDYKGNVETGIGNTQYKTMFAPLYNLEMRR